MADLRSGGTARTDDGNLLMGIAGALAGALAGGAVYYGVMAITGIQVGYVACLVGAASGYGSLLLGKAPSLANGVSCALFSLAAIGGAEYLTFQAYLDGVKEASDYFTVANYQTRPTRDDYDTDEEFSEGLAGHEDFVKLTPEEQQKYVEEQRRSFEEFMASDFTFVDYLTSSTYDMLVTLLFAFLGISYGYKIGTGASRADE